MQARQLSLGARTRTLTQRLDLSCPPARFVNRLVHKVFYAPDVVLRWRCVGTHRIAGPHHRLVTSRRMERVMSRVYGDHMMRLVCPSTFHRLRC